MLRIAICQDSFSRTDVAYNAKKIKDFCANTTADLFLFPALAMCGHLPSAVITQGTFEAAVRTAIGEIKTDGVVLFGYPYRDYQGLFNSISIIGNGARGFYHQQNAQVPFTGGRNNVIFKYKDINVGLLFDNELDQARALKDSGAELLLVFNTTPFCVDIQKTRQEALSALGLPCVFVNAVGAYDEYLFDGGSMVINADGQIAHEAPRFMKHTIIANFDDGKFDEHEKAPLNLSPESQMYQALVVGLRDYVMRARAGGVIVGLSGGIDSALTLCIAVDALGADKVYAVMMPYIHTSQMSLEDAQAQATRLGVSYTVCAINEAMEGFKRALDPMLESAKSVVKENLQARCRGVILMALSNEFGYLVLNTGNKSESAVGYCTLYGDMVGAFGVLQDVYKTDVYRLADYRNRLASEPVIPARVITRAPSAELSDGQTDQDTLPDYDTLDGILRLYVDKNMEKSAIIAKGFDEKTVEKVLDLVDKSEHKRRQAAVGVQITPMPFFKRIMPIINEFRE